MILVYSYVAITGERVFLGARVPNVLYSYGARARRTRAQGVLVGLGLRLVVAATGGAGGDGCGGRQRGERVEEHELRVAGDGHHCRVGRVGREQRARVRERVAARAEHFGRLAAHVVHCEHADEHQFEMNDA